MGSLISLLPFKSKWPGKSQCFNFVEENMKTLRNSCFRVSTTLRSLKCPTIIVPTKKIFSTPT